MPHLAHMRRQGRKNTKGVEQVLTKHLRPYFSDRLASTGCWLART